jgi:hypothetical protein
MEGTIELTSALADSSKDWCAALGEWRLAPTGLGAIRGESC